MTRRTCHITGCHQFPLQGRYGRSCRLCDGLYCRLHLEDKVHNCPKLKDDPDAYDRRFYLRENERLRLLSSMLQEKAERVCGRASSLRDGVRCIIDSSASSLSRMMGGQHCHAEIIFDDQARWLLRISIDTASAPVEVRNYVLQSEAATMRFLKEKTNLPTPKVYHCALEGDESNELGLGYIMMEKMPGKPLNWQDVEEGPKGRWFLKQLADVFLELERHPLASMGSIISNASLSIGGIAHPATIGESGPLGPFSTATEAYRTIVQEYLDQIVAGELAYNAPVDAYLRLRWMLNRFPQALPFKEEEGVHLFYLKHPDDKGDHTLVDDELNITGIIDWEWCTSESKAYAFSSPCMMWPVADFYASSNRLSPSETALASIFRDEHNRADLAEFILRGRPLQRFVHCVMNVPSTEGEDHETTVALFKGLVSAWGDGEDVLNRERDAWWEKWRAEALDRYRDDPGLQLLLHQHANRRGGDGQAV